MFEDLEISDPSLDFEEVSDDMDAEGHHLKRVLDVDDNLKYMRCMNND